MKKTLTTLLTALAMVLVAANVYAAPKKREPNKITVENYLKKLGGIHYPEGIKRIRSIGGAVTGEEDDVDKAYFWLFSAAVGNDNTYNLYVYDNADNYLGFYEVDAAPAECDGGYVLFEMNDDGEDDNDDGESESVGSNFKSINFAFLTPPKRINPGGTPCEFIPAPEPVKEEIPETGTTTGTTRKSDVKKMTGKPVYRAWHVTLGDMVVEVECAILVEERSGMVTIKDGKSGNRATKPLKDFSPDDQQYVKSLYL